MRPSVDVEALWLVWTPNFGGSGVNADKRWTRETLLLLLEVAKNFSLIAGIHWCHWCHWNPFTGCCSLPIEVHGLELVSIWYHFECLETTSLLIAVNSDAEMNRICKANTGASFVVWGKTDYRRLWNLPFALESHFIASQLSQEGKTCERFLSWNRWIVWRCRIC